MALVASDASAAFSGVFIFSILVPEPVPVGYFTTQAQRQLRVLDQHLGKSRYLAGETYSVADVLAYPVAATSSKLLPGGVADYPALQRWADEVGSRPAVRRGMEAAIAAGHGH